MITDLKPYPAMKDSGVPWLRKVPEHWEVRRLKYLLRERNGCSVDGSEQLLRVSQYTGVTKRTYVDGNDEPDTRAESLVGYKRVEPEDLVVNIMLAWNGSMGVSQFQGIASPAYCVYRFKPDAHPWYFHHLLRSPLYKGRIKTASTGVVESRLRLYTDDLYRLEALLPPPAEQAAIVRFLDHADRRIRRYIRAKQKLIKLLEEQKQAIIHRAVTRGLDPNVRLKPSGVEWLGDVPEHWGVRKLGQIAISFRTGPFGSILHQSDYVEGGTPVINPTHMARGRIVEDTHCSVSPPVTDRLINYRLELHDLIFSRRGELGRCALVRDREVGWLCGTGSIRVRVHYTDIEPEYLIKLMQVRWVGEYLSLFSIGATMDSLNTGILKGVPLLVPPINEQRAILACIAEEGPSIDRAVADTHCEIELLREYRTRLIADVVTGKLDVRGAAAKLPDEAEEPERLDDAGRGETSFAPMEDAESEDLDAVPDEADA
jgi:type I restriction enzyme S subunit